MRTRNVCLPLLIGSLLLISTVAHAEEAKRPPIYDESGNAKQLIAAALKNAKQNNKRVLLQYGGNWCGWCYRLHDFVNNDNDLKKLMAYEYEWVMVDTGSNPDIAKRYKAEARSVPYFTVLDIDGNVMTHQNTEPFEENQSYNAERLTAFLQKWKAPPLNAKSVLDEAAAAAKKSGKKLMAHFGAPWCGYCKKLEAFLSRDDIAPLIEQSWVPVKIDTDRMAGGMEMIQDLRKKHNGTGGIPWFVIMDADQNALATSDAPGSGNIGFPVVPHEVEHFGSLLKNHSTLSEKEIAFVLRELRKK